MTYAVRMAAGSKPVVEGLEPGKEVAFLGRAPDGNLYLVTKLRGEMIDVGISYKNTDLAVGSGSALKTAYVINATQISHRGMAMIDFMLPGDDYADFLKWNTLCIQPPSDAALQSTVRGNATTLTLDRLL